MVVENFLVACVSKCHEMFASLLRGNQEEAEQPIPFNVYMNKLHRKREMRTTTWNAKFNLSQRKKILSLFECIFDRKENRMQKKLLMKCPNGAISQEQLSSEQCEKTTTKKYVTINRMIFFSSAFVDWWNSHHENVCYARNANSFDQKNSNKNNLTHLHAMRVCKANFHSTLVLMNKHSQNLLSQFYTYIYIFMVQMSWCRWHLVWKFLVVSSPIKTNTHWAFIRSFVRSFWFLSNERRSCKRSFRNIRAMAMALAPNIQHKSENEVDNWDERDYTRAKQCVAVSCAWLLATDT